MNAPRTIGKQRIHRRVENTGKRAADVTARREAVGKPRNTPPQTNIRACRNHTIRLQPIPQANPSEKTSQLKAEIGETEKADKRNRTTDRCPEQIQISTDRKCGFAYARASDGRTRPRSQKSINRRNRNGRGPNPGRIANNRQPSPTCRHPHTYQSIPHYGRNRIGRDTGTTASFAPGRPS